jgi:hypothetical protein
MCYTSLISCPALSILLILSMSYLCFYLNSVYASITEEGSAINNSRWSLGPSRTPAVGLRKSQRGGQKLEGCGGTFAVFGAPYDTCLDLGLLGCFLFWPALVFYPSCFSFLCLFCFFYLYCISIGKLVNDRFSF